MSLKSWQRLVSGRTSRGRAAAVSGQSLPFVSMDWFFPRFPQLTADKFRWMIRYLQGSFFAGALFVVFVYHPPYVGADYDHEWKSPLYKWTMQRLRDSGQYDENLSIKRTAF